MIFKNNHYKVKHKILKALAKHYDSISDNNEQVKYTLNLEEIVEKTKLNKDEVLEQLDSLDLAEDIHSDKYNREDRFMIGKKGYVSLTTNKYILEYKKENLDLNLKRTQITTLIITVSVLLWNQYGSDLAQKNSQKFENLQTEIIKIQSNISKNQSQIYILDSLTQTLKNELGQQKTNK